MKKPAAFKCIRGVRSLHLYSALRLNCVQFVFKWCVVVFCRGFGFITFGDPSSVDKVLAQGAHELDGKKVSPNLANYTVFFFISRFVFRVVCFTQSVVRVEYG